MRQHGQIAVEKCNGFDASLMAKLLHLVLDADRPAEVQHGMGIGVHRDDAGEASGPDGDTQHRPFPEFPVTDRRRSLVPCRRLRPPPPPHIHHHRAPLLRLGRRGRRSRHHHARHHARGRGGLVRATGAIQEIDSRQAVSSADPL